MQIYGLTLETMERLFPSQEATTLLRAHSETLETLLSSMVPIESQFQHHNGACNLTSSDTSILPIKLKLAVRFFYGGGWMMMDNASNLPSFEKDKQGYTAHMLGGVFSGDVIMGRYPDPSFVLKCWKPHDLIRFCLGRLVYEEFEFGLSRKRKTQIDHVLLQALLRGAFSSEEFLYILSILGMYTPKEYCEKYFLHVSKKYGVTIVVPINMVQLKFQRNMIKPSRFIAENGKQVPLVTIQYHPEVTQVIRTDRITPVEFLIDKRIPPKKIHTEIEYLTLDYGKKLLSACINTPFDTMFVPDYLVNILDKRAKRDSMLSNKVLGGKKESEEYNVELTKEQIAQCDKVENAVLDMCRVLTENPDLEHDMSIVGDIADYATDVLVEHQHAVHYPAILSGEDGKQSVREWIRSLEYFNKKTKEEE